MIHPYIAFTPPAFPLRIALLTFLVTAPGAISTTSRFFRFDAGVRTDDGDRRSLISTPRPSSVDRTKGTAVPLASRTFMPPFNERYERDGERERERERERECDVVVARAASVWRIALLISVRSGAARTHARTTPRPRPRLSHQGSRSFLSSVHPVSSRCIRCRDDNRDMLGKEDEA